MGGLCVEDADSRRNFLLGLVDKERDEEERMHDWVRERVKTVAYEHVAESGGRTAALAARVAIAADIVTNELYRYMDGGEGEGEFVAEEIAAARGPRTRRGASRPSWGILGWLYGRAAGGGDGKDAPGEGPAQLADAENDGAALDIGELERRYTRQFLERREKDTAARLKQRESFSAFLDEVRAAGRVFERAQQLGVSLSDTLAALTPGEALAVTVVLEEDLRRVERVPATSPQGRLQRALGIVSGPGRQQRQQNQRRQRRRPLPVALKMALFWRDIAISLQVVLYLLVGTSNVLNAAFFAMAFWVPDYWMSSGGSIALVLLVLTFTTTLVLLAPLVGEALYWVMFRDTINDRTSTTARRSAASALAAHTTAGLLTIFLLAMDWGAGLDEHEGRQDDVHYMVCMIGYVLMAFSAVKVIFNLPGAFRWCARWGALYASLPSIQRTVNPRARFAKETPPEDRFREETTAAAARKNANVFASEQEADDDEDKQRRAAAVISSYPLPQPYETDSLVSASPENVSLYSAEVEWD